MYYRKKITSFRLLTNFRTLYVVNNCCFVLHITPFIKIHNLKKKNYNNILSQWRCVVRSIAALNTHQFITLSFYPEVENYKMTRTIWCYLNAHLLLLDVTVQTILNQPNMSILSVGDINYKQPRQESYGHLTAELNIYTADSWVTGSNLQKEYLL